MINGQYLFSFSGNILQWYLERDYVLKQMQKTSVFCINIQVLDIEPQKQYTGIVAYIYHGSDKNTC